MAPIINMRGSSGVQQIVIDPSTQPGPVPVDVWLSAMGTPASGYQRMTHAQLMQHLADAQAAGGPMVNGFPRDEQLAWTTDRIDAAVGP